MLPVLIDFYFSGQSTVRSIAALHRIYPRYSLKRRLAYLANGINLLTVKREPLALGLMKNILASATASGTGTATALLLHKLEQNGRVYAFSLNERSELQAVTKIALTQPARRGVVREQAVLQNIDRGKLPFQIPSVMSSFDYQGAYFLCLNAASRELCIHDKSAGLPDYIFDSIASLRPQAAPSLLPCKSFPWFDAAMQRITNPAIKEIARKINPDCTFDIAAAHCDLGSENVFSTHNHDPREPQFAIIDWEYFTETAPAMTDRVAYWLGQHHRLFKRRIGGWSGRAAATSFLDAFSKSPGGTSAAVFALIGLLYMGNDLAERLCGE